MNPINGVIEYTATIGFAKDNYTTLKTAAEYVRKWGAIK